MATKNGLLNLGITPAASEAAARATGQMLLRATTTTGEVEVNDPATGTGLLAVNTRAVNGFLELQVNS